MKNTKMRKKMLLSSIAMLMVATVSLGSATYAWFTTNPTSTAQGVKIKAVAADGLQVLSETQKADNDYVSGSSGPKYSDGWSHNAKLNWDIDTKDTSEDSFELDAVSFDLGKTDKLDTTAARFEAAADGASAAKSDSQATVNAAGFYREKVYAKLTGSKTQTEVKLTGVKVNFKAASATINHPIRVAVSYHDNTKTSDKDTLLGVYSKNGGEISYIPTTNTGTLYNAITPQNKTIKALAVSDDGLFATSGFVTAGNVDTTGNCYFEVTVYLDGQDADCYTNNVNADDIIDSILLNFSV